MFAAALFVILRDAELMATFLTGTLPVDDLPPVMQVLQLRINSSRVVQGILQQSLSGSSSLPFTRVPRNPDLISHKVYRPLQVFGRTIQRTSSG